jgi:hypothetical protein
VLRWLLPLITAIAFMGSSALTWAASGIIGESECCCPDKTKCKCHDHDGKPRRDAELKRCGGEAKLVTPVVISAVTPVIPDAMFIAPAERVETVAAQPVPTDRTVEPEKPPF